jgi:hypothetical protein
MTHTFSKSAFYNFGDIPLADPLPPIFLQLLRKWVGFTLRFRLESGLKKFPWSNTSARLQLSLVP